MRVRGYIAVAAAGLVLAVMGTAGAVAAPVPVDKPGAWMQVAAETKLSGDQAALEAAIKDASGVKYKILVVDKAPEGEEMTAYLDRVAESWGQPQPDTLLLIVFTGAGNDIRFFMGADFRRQGVGVDEMLGFVRSVYLPRAGKGDPAGALADLIRTVNRRMNPQKAAAVQVTPQQAMRTLLTHVGDGNARALAAMVEPHGLVVVPYRRAGTPDEGLPRGEAQKVLLQLLEGAKPQVAGYSMQTEGRVDVALTGLQAATLPGSIAVTPESLVKVSIRQDQKGEWFLWLLAVDDQGWLLQELKTGAYQKPFDWLTLGGRADGASQITHRREPAVQPSGRFSWSLSDAREHFGGRTSLPEGLEGKEMYLYTQPGVMTGFSAATDGLWIREWHQGFERVAISWGSDIQVGTRHEIVGGRPALRLAFGSPKGKLFEELWMVEGNVVYELRAGYPDTMDDLLKRLGSGL